MDDDSGFPSDEELRKLDIKYELDKLGYATSPNKKDPSFLKPKKKKKKNKK